MDFPHGLDDYTGDLDQEVWLFLLTKRAPRLVGARCTNRRTDEGGGAGGMEGFRLGFGTLMHRCGRPVWGDGKGVQGRGEGLCSRCWHEWNAFHGDYTTMQANPAASLLSGAKIHAMEDIFGRRGGTALPSFDDVFPDDWNIHR